MNEDPSGLVLELRSTFRAPRERVYRMLSDPAELAKWWGPRGFTMPASDVDFRVGGGYRLSMQPSVGDLFHLSGEFLEIDPPVRLAYTFRWDEPTPDDRESIVKLDLQARGDDTEIVLTHGPFATDERLVLHQGGWTDSFERLREVLSSGS